MPDEPMLSRIAILFGILFGFFALLMGAIALARVKCTSVVCHQKFGRMRWFASFVSQCIMQHAAVLVYRGLMLLTLKDLTGLTLGVPRYWVWVQTHHGFPGSPSFVFG